SRPIRLVSCAGRLLPGIALQRGLCDHYSATGGPTRIAPTGDPRPLASGWPTTSAAPAGTARTYLFRARGICAPEPARGRHSRARWQGSAQGLVSRLGGRSTRGADGKPQPGAFPRRSSADPVAAICAHPGLPVVVCCDPAAIETRKELLASLRYRSLLRCMRRGPGLLPCGRRAPLPGQPALAASSGWRWTC